METLARGGKDRAMGGEESGLVRAGLHTEESLSDFFGAGLGVWLAFVSRRKGGGLAADRSGDLRGFLAGANLALHRGFDLLKQFGLIGFKGGKRGLRFGQRKVGGFGFGLDGSQGGIAIGNQLFKVGLQVAAFGDSRVKFGLGLKELFFDGSHNFAGSVKLNPSLRGLRLRGSLGNAGFKGSQQGLKGRR